MPWTKIDDRFPRHPKSVNAGPYGRDLFVCGLCYCNEHLTDGFIPTNAVSMLAPGLPNAFRIGERLVSVGLWERVEGGFRVHDFAEYQPARARVHAQRAANRDRLQRWREKNVVSNGVTHASRNGASNASGNAAPDPTRPENLKPTPLRDEVARLDRDFEDFYGRYPRRKAPGAAKRAYRAARSKASRDVIHAALEAQRSDMLTWPTAKIPWPATWLNGEQWRNEADAPPGEPAAELWPNLYDCVQCGGAHETRGCPKQPAIDPAVRRDVAERAR